MAQKQTGSPCRLRSLNSPRQPFIPAASSTPQTCRRSPAPRPVSPDELDWMRRSEDESDQVEEEGFAIYEDDQDDEFPLDLELPTGPWGNRDRGDTDLPAWARTQSRSARQPDDDLPAWARRGPVRHDPYLSLGPGYTDVESKINCTPAMDLPEDYYYNTTPTEPSNYEPQSDADDEAANSLYTTACEELEKSYEEESNYQTASALDSGAWEMGILTKMEMEMSENEPFSGVLTHTPSDATPYFPGGKLAKQKKRCKGLFDTESSFEESLKEQRNRLNRKRRKEARGSPCSSAGSSNLPQETPESYGDSSFDMQSSNNSCNATGDESFHTPRGYPNQSYYSTPKQSSGGSPYDYSNSSCYQTPNSFYQTADNSSFYETARDFPDSEDELERSAMEDLVARALESTESAEIAEVMNSPMNLTI